MATYQDRENGTCTARIRSAGHSESKTFNAAGGATARERATAWALNEEKKMLDGGYLSPALSRTTTLLEALTDYDLWAQAENRGYEAEKYRIAGWQNWKYASNKLSELTEQKFMSWRDERRLSVSDATIKLEFAVIAAVFKHKNYGIGNPAAFVAKSLKPAKKRDRRLGAIEQDYLLDQLFDTRCSDEKRANRYLPHIVLFGMENSCRLSEVCPNPPKKTAGLLSKNVKIDGGCGTAKFLLTKNDKDRFSPLSPGAIEAIRAAWVISGDSKNGAVFKTTAGAIKQAWSRAKKRAIAQYKADCIKAGDEPIEGFLVDFRFHDLRHHAASKWSRHLTKFELKKMTGHIDDRSIDVYVNPDEDDALAASRKMAAVVRKEAVV